MKAEELKENGHRLFEAGQYSNAIPFLKSAAEAFPDDEILWQELVSAASCSGQHEQSVEFAKSAIRKYPRSDWFWLQLGHELTIVEKFDEAEKALNHAQSLTPNVGCLWRYFSALYQKRKNFVKESELLENLFSLGEATSTDLNQLGIAYHNQRNFAKALEFYRNSFLANTDPAPLFNMGLVFNEPEVSQDADAADVYRRALTVNPDYKTAQERLENTKQKLVPLSERARVAAKGIIQSDEIFRFYISPFEAFHIEVVESVEELDVKVIQRARKQLLQEIDLNDGMVSWLDDYPLDKARALATEDELYDEKKRRYHWAIFQNKQLLSFLTRGDIRHFLYSDDYFPLDTLELLEKEPKFCEFLSQPFAKQYNFILTRAIERRILPVVEVLFDGRRWVEPEDDDICFEGAFKRIGDLVDMMRSKASEGQTRKVNLSEIENFLHQYSLPELFNLLPTTFASMQRDFVAEIRSLAISCFNQHDDSDLSKKVLSLCKRFTSRSVELNKRLEEDFKTIEKMIVEEHKYDSRLKFSGDRPFEITKEGVRDGAKFFPASSISAFRWGITITGHPGVEYLFAVQNDAGETIMESWAANKSNEDNQTKYFSSIVNATMHYHCAAVIEKVHERLTSGQHVVIGPCTLTLQGISFQTQGFIFNRNRFVTWRDVITDTINGQIVISSKLQDNLTINVSMRDTYNAVLLPIVISVLDPEHISTEKTTTGFQRQQRSSNKSGTFILITIVLVILGIMMSVRYSNSIPKSNSYAPPISPRLPAYSPPSYSDESESETKTVYRVPSYISAELDRDRQAIEKEKEQIQLRQSQLETLQREIEQEELYLDTSSESEVNKFNRKVEEYNALVEKTRSQTLKMNHMVDGYNEKLEKHGR